MVDEHLHRSRFNPVPKSGPGCTGSFSLRRSGFIPESLQVQRGQGQNTASSQHPGQLEGWGLLETVAGCSKEKIPHGETKTQPLSSFSVVMLKTGTRWK